MYEDTHSQIAHFENLLNQKIGALESYQKDRALVQEEVNELNLRSEEPIAHLKISERALKKFRDTFATNYQNEVTSALQYIMGTTVRDTVCRISFPEDGTQMDITIRIDFENGRILEGKPQDIKGGGARDSIAVTFLTSYIRQNPDIVGPVWMDEPTKQLSEAHSETFYNYMGHIAPILGNQIIMVTHDLKVASQAKYKHKVIKVDMDLEGSAIILTE